MVDFDFGHNAKRLLENRNCVVRSITKRLEENEGRMCRGDRGRGASEIRGGGEDEGKRGGNGEKALV